MGTAKTSDGTHTPSWAATGHWFTTVEITHLLLIIPTGMQHTVVKPMYGHAHQFSGVYPLMVLQVMCIRMKLQKVIASLSTSLSKSQEYEAGFQCTGQRKAEVSADS